MAGTSVTARATERELWGPRVSDVAGFQKEYYVRKKKVFTCIKDTISWVYHHFRQCCLLPSFFFFFPLLLNVLR